VCLPVDQPHAGNNRDAEFGNAGQQRFAMAEAVDRGDTGAEGDGTQRRALPVEGVAGARRMRQEAQAERQRGEPDREVDGEQIRPGRNREDCRRHAGADRGGNRHHHGIQPDAAAELRAGIDEAHQRGVDAHDSRGAKSLNDTRYGQRREVMRERAGQRGDGEQQ
jgi:hypothetical protein